MAENHDFEGVSPILAGIPDNDIIFSQKHHVLAPKMRRREISLYVIVQYQEEGVMAARLIFAHFEFFNAFLEVMASYFKPKIEI